MLPLKILSPLILVFLLCDAGSTCPTDENPLELDPPEVIEEYSETGSVVVNCTSTDEYHDRMFWKLGNQTSDEELDKNYILQSVPLSDWNVKAECTVNVDSRECSKELGITLYKTPDIVSVSALHHGPIEEGTEYSLNCSISNVAPVKNLKVIWYKGNKTVSREEFIDTRMTPVDVSSSLRVTAKRDDNGALYRCSAELHLGPNGPELIPNATSSPYTAVVFYKPLVQTCPDHYTGVEHDFSLDMLDCPADGNPPPSVQWSYRGKPISASKPLNRTHSGNYTVEFANTYGKSSTSVYITMEYPPSFTCNDYYEVKEDKFQTVCEPKGLPQPVTTWFKDGEEIATPQRWTKKDSGSYFLNATNKHGTAQHQLTVNVLYAPELKNDTEDVFVNEGTNVTLTCEAEGNPPPVFNWTWNDGKMSGSANIVNIPQVITSTAYTCTASNDLGSVTKQIHVHVIKSTRMANPAAMATTKAPTQRDCSLKLMPAETVVKFGDKVSVNCSTPAKEVSAMGWEATIGGIRLTNVSAITWTIDKLETWTIGPMCYLNRKDGRQCTLRAAITVYKTPDIVSVSALHHGPIEEGTEYSLNCSISNVAPVKNLKVIWYKGNKTVSREEFIDTRMTPVDVSSSLRVTAKRDDNGALYRCSAELHLGPNGPELIPNATSSPYTAVVFYKPLVQTCPDHYTGVEHDFSLDMLDCPADGNPPPSVQWSYRGKPISASKPLNRTHSGNYTVEFANTYGKSSTSVYITMEYPPSFTCNDYYEVKEDKFQTVCEPKGLPQPVTTWFKDGEEIATPQRWTKKDSGSYFLNATNKHGTAQHQLTVNVLYAPVFKEKNYSKEVATGENVTLECVAEGNPPPEIRWNYTTAENVIAGGRQKNIFVTGATSTNAGVYICVATNKVGSVSRSVTLILEGKTSGFPTAVIWPLLIVLIIVIIAFIIYCNRKKHGQYNFVPDRPIPLTTEGVHT